MGLPTLRDSARASSSALSRMSAESRSRMRPRARGLSLLDDGYTRCAAGTERAAGGSWPRRAVRQAASEQEVCQRNLKHTQEEEGSERRWRETKIGREERKNGQRGANVAPHDGRVRCVMLAAQRENERREEK